MKKQLFALPCLMLLCAAAPALADTVTYNFVVNTSSQSGNSGYIDFELNPGSLGASPITASVSSFTGATLKPADPNNDAIGTTGTLPGTVTLSNQVGNDYFEALTFGSTLSFTATLTGPGISTSGTASSLSGTVFQLSFFDPSISSALFSSDPSGIDASLNIAPNGTTTVTAQSGTAVTPASPATAVTPEPGTLSLVGLAGASIGIVRRRFAHGLRRSAR